MRTRHQPAAQDDLPPVDEEEESRQATQVDPWDSQLFNPPTGEPVSLTMIFEIIMVRSLLLATSACTDDAFGAVTQAANFLDIKPLMESTCKEVAVRIKGRCMPRDAPCLFAYAPLLL